MTDVIALTKISPTVCDKNKTGITDIEKILFTEPSAFCIILLTTLIYFLGRKCENTRIEI